MTQGPCPEPLKKNPHGLDMGLPPFSASKVCKSSVKESLWSNSQSKSYGRAKFWMVIDDKQWKHCIQFDPTRDLNLRSTAPKTNTLMLDLLTRSFDNEQ